MIQNCESMQLAYNVLLALNQLVEGKEELDLTRFWVEAYSNGREQGYCVRSSRMTACFAQLRGSDAIIVYIGDAYSFSMQGNVPENREKVSSRCFDKDEHEKAAWAIYGEMLKAHPAEDAA